MHSSWALRLVIRAIGIIVMLVGFFLAASELSSAIFLNILGIILIMLS